MSIAAGALQRSQSGQHSRFSHRQTRRRHAHRSGDQSREREVDRAVGCLNICVHAISHRDAFAQSAEKCGGESQLLRVLNSLASSLTPHRIFASPQLRGPTIAQIGSFCNPGLKAGCTGAVSSSPGASFLVTLSLSHSGAASVLVDGTWLPILNCVFPTFFLQ